MVATFSFFCLLKFVSDRNFHYLCKYENHDR